MICKNCNNIFESKNLNRKFCSHSCSSIFNNKNRSIELKEKLWKSSMIKNKGKTWEDKFGKERADLIKQKLSDANSGKNNPNYGGKYSHGYAEEYLNKLYKGKTLEERVGKERANLIKAKLSKANSGENNPMYGKPSPKKSGNGWSGYYQKFYFRSLLELSYLKYLLDNNIKFQKGELKKYKIKYEINNKQFTYSPDFFLNETKELIEIKPSNLINSFVNKIKFEAARLIYKDSFKIITEKNINIISKNELLSLIQNNLVKFDKSKIEKILKNLNNGRKQIYYM